MTPTTLINGQAYSFVDVTFDILNITESTGFKGVPIKAISYNVGQQKTMNYENSKYPTSVSYGKITSTGSLTLTLDSAEILRDAIFSNGVRERSIVGCPSTDITLTFSNKGKLNTTTLHNVCFITENMSGTEGDDTLSVTCDFICSFIDFGGLSTIGTFVTLANDGVDTVFNNGDNQGIV